MTEIRVRVKDHIKELLEKNKDKFGVSINFQVNFAIYKYLIIDINKPYWLVAKYKPQYAEVINQLPEDVKYCDSDRCEIDPRGDKR